MKKLNIIVFILSLSVNYMYADCPTSIKVKSSSSLKNQYSILDQEFDGIKWAYESEERFTAEQLSSTQLHKVEVYRKASTDSSKSPYIICNYIIPKSNAYFNLKSEPLRDVRALLPALWSNKLDDNDTVVSICNQKDHVAGCRFQAWPLSSNNKNSGEIKHDSIYWEE